eukprot:GHVS01010359.1.p1 GENE.GHVS01010359.1~~GHVS01010359.1.p1  ORF type:complete len:929 (-),score=286.60 GHVS01010359.1:196-2982(-)
MTTPAPERVSFTVEEVTYSPPDPQQTSCPPPPSTTSQQLAAVVGPPSSTGAVASSVAATEGSPPSTPRSTLSSCQSFVQDHPPPPPPRVLRGSNPSPCAAVWTSTLSSSGNSPLLPPVSSGDQLSPPTLAALTQQSFNNRPVTAAAAAQQNGSSTSPGDGVSVMADFCSSSPPPASTSPSSPAEEGEGATRLSQHPTASTHPLNPHLDYLLSQNHAAEAGGAGGDDHARMSLSPYHPLSSLSSASPSFHHVHHPSAHLLNCSLGSDQTNKLHLDTLNPETQERLLNYQTHSQQQHHQLLHREHQRMVHHHNQLYHHGNRPESLLSSSQSPVTNTPDYPSHNIPSPSPPLSSTRSSVLRQPSVDGGAGDDEVVSVGRTPSESTSTQSVMRERATSDSPLPDSPPPQPPSHHHHHHHRAPPPPTSGSVEPSTDPQQLTNSIFTDSTTTAFQPSDTSRRSHFGAAAAVPSSAQQQQPAPSSSVVFTAPSLQLPRTPLTAAGPHLTQPPAASANSSGRCARSPVPPPTLFTASSHHNHHQPVHNSAAVNPSTSSEQPPPSACWVRLSGGDRCSSIDNNSMVNASSSRDNNNSQPQPLPSSSSSLSSCNSSPHIRTAVSSSPLNMSATSVNNSGAFLLPVPESTAHSATTTGRRTTLLSLSSDEAVRMQHNNSSSSSFYGGASSTTATTPPAPTTALPPPPPLPPVAAPAAPVIPQTVGPPASRLQSASAAIPPVGCNSGAEALYDGWCSEASRLLRGPQQQHGGGRCEEVWVSVSSPELKFNCAHFVAFKGFRERLHGHNYTVAMKLGGAIGQDGYVMDFGDIKTTVKRVCQSLNEYFIVPMRSDVLDITVEGDNISIRAEDGATFVFPKSDCMCLPIVHSTAEELSVFLWNRFVEILTPQFLEQRGVEWLEVSVSELPTQSAFYRRQLALH